MSERRSRFSDDVDPDHPWPEYPRPHLRREAWTNLNGRWELAITGTDDPPPAGFDREILVPYPIGSALSGVDHTLQPTAVVNEAYLRLLKLNRIGWQDRSHFFAISARLIRRILVDHARHHGFAKRGGGTPDLPIADAPELIIERPEEMVHLDQALMDLEQFDTDKASIVELKFFGGLTNDEIAEIRGVSRTTVVRHWRVAKAWLFRELSQRA